MRWRRRGWWAAMSYSTGWVSDLSLLPAIVWGFPGRCRTSLGTPCATARKRACGCSETETLLKLSLMTTDRASRSPTGGPCLRHFIALNRLLIAQLPARVLALQLRLGLSSGSTVAQSRLPTRQVAAPDCESFCPETLPPT